MTHRSVGLAATIAVAVFAAACDQAPPSAPQPDGPSFAQGASPFACVFSGNPSVGNAANAYFTTSGERKTASDIIAVMQAGFTGADPYAGARDAGFDLLSFTGKVSRGGTAGDTASGSALIRQALQCMFNVDAADNTAQDPFFGWPTNSQFNFGRALVATAGGAFFVRGGTNTDPAGVVDPGSAPVVANDVNLVAFGGLPKDGNLSGMGPDAAHTWRIPTSTGILANRVLIYGQPVSQGYDWKLIPRSTLFTPNVTVALCPAATTASSTTADMITQAQIGVLGYVNADAICGTDPATFARGGSVIDRMTRYASRLLAPAPLQAATVASTPVGGTARTAKGDIFTVRTVQNVQLTMTLLVPGTNTPKAWPPQVKVNDGVLGDILIDVKTLAAPQAPVGGVEVILKAVNNNGFTLVGEKTSSGCGPVVPRTTESVVSPSGLTTATQVRWNNACITKTGIVSVLATSTAKGRSGGIGAIEGPKFNVKPK